jgi:hypothetical protein
MSVLLPACQGVRVPVTFPAEPSLGPWGRALFAAIERGDPEAVQWALTKGADVHAYRPFEEVLIPAEPGRREGVIIQGGWTALHQACMADQAADVASPVHAIVELLLAAGANPQQPLRTLDALPMPPMTGLDMASSNPASFAPQLCELLCARGAHPTGLTVRCAAQDSPHFAHLVPFFFRITPRDRHADLWDHHPMDDLVNRPLDQAQTLERLRCLVQHGGNLDQCLRNQSVTVAQALTRANPHRGAQVVEALRAAQP